MTAAPATAEYGRLTVMLQAVFAIERLFTVPPGAFRPAPKVDSAVTRLVPLRERAPAIADRGLFARVVGAASRNGARRCATRWPRCATPTPCGKRASIPVRAGRRSRSRTSCVWPTRWRADRGGRRATSPASVLAEDRVGHEQHDLRHEHEQHVTTRRRPGTATTRGCRRRSGLQDRAHGVHRRPDRRREVADGDGDDEHEPKCTGSKPSSLTSGRKIGVSMMISTEPSTKQPANNSHADDQGHHRMRSVVRPSMPPDRSRAPARRRCRSRRCPTARSGT